MGKATTEIHAKVEGEGEQEHLPSRAGATFTAVVVQIALLDIVFSLDSVITAVGMADHLSIMVIAVVLAVVVMMVMVGSISRFIEKHPTVKMLALAFLMLIGVALVADGMGMHIPKGYIYFSMAFSAAVEALNLRARDRQRSGETP
jgi:predicted tellurium resistance membrane protein TerC